LVSAFRRFHFRIFFVGDDDQDGGDGGVRAGHVPGGFVEPSRSLHSPDRGDGIHPERGQPEPVRRQDDKGVATPPRDQQDTK
jgi:hypothetical protein